MLRNPPPATSSCRGVRFLHIRQPGALQDIHFEAPRLRKSPGALQAFERSSDCHGAEPKAKVKLPPSCLTSDYRLKTYEGMTIPARLPTIVEKDRFIEVARMSSLRGAESPASAWRPRKAAAGGKSHRRKLLDAARLQPKLGDLLPDRIPNDCGQVFGLAIRLIELVIGLLPERVLFSSFAIPSARATRDG